jgi:rare lipoprotein A
MRFIIFMMMLCLLFSPAQGYPKREYGVASWYGKQHHGRKTASGEIFNMNELTAAHRTLPFGTQVIVRNMLNGEMIVVRINDRGPFVGNRVIDLSKAAAEALHIKGTAKVELRT